METAEAKEYKPAVVFVDGDADERVAVIDTDLGDVPRVVTDGDRVPDEGGEGGCEVTLALEVDTVTLHHSILRNS